MQRKGLSTAGLSASLATITDAKEQLVTSGTTFAHTFEAEVDRVRPDPDQPRRVFAQERLDELAATMAVQGQLSPILVRPDADAGRGAWIIVAGERRWRAAKFNGWTRILAIEHSDNHEVAQLVENLQRADLNLIEEARGLQRLLKVKEWSQARAAAALGKRQGELSATMRVLTLPEDLLMDYLKSDTPPSRAAMVELARVPAGRSRERLAQMARAGTLTVQAIRAARSNEDVLAGAADSTLTRDSPVASPRDQSRWLTSRRLLSIAERVRAMRALYEPIGPARRDALTKLREEIDSVLAQHEGES